MDELLAKPDKTLKEHTLEVYKLGKKIAQRLRLKEEDYKRALLACLFHDIGKATKSFQEYMRGARKKSFPHALASLPFILIAESQSVGSPFIATAAVLSHHSPLSPRLYEGWGSPEFLIDKIIKHFLENISEILSNFGVNYEEVVKKAFKLTHPSSVLHGGNKKILIEFKNIPRDRYASVKTVLQLADWLASGQKQDVEALFLHKGKEKLTNFITNKSYTLWEFQKEASRNNNENIKLRAPTGSGKTEALLLWASKAKRIIYLLPTQATVNAMWKRLSEIFDEENVGLAHGRAKYTLWKKWKEEHYEDEPPLDLHLLGSVFAKPVNVATLDQYLLGFLNGRHWEERQTLSKNSYVIIDEVHTYEPFTLGILKYVLEHCRPQKLGVASATFPDVLLNFFGEAKFIKADAFFWERKRHKLRCLDASIKEAVKKAIESANDGKKVLIIVNTVPKAQELYQVIKSKWQETILLHSRFTLRDRIKQEEKALQADNGQILISTQIVEVSLDISFDLLFTEIAPVDALIQRMGRVNRLGKNPPAEVVVYTVYDDASQKIYGKDLLELSKEVVCKLPECPEEQILVNATNELYREITKGEDFKKDLHEGYRNVEELQKIMGNFTVDLGDEDIRTKFMTRKGIFTVEVIPEEFKDEAYRMLEKGEKWRLVELTVPIHGYWTKIWPDSFVCVKDFGYPVIQADYNRELGLLTPDSWSYTFEMW